MSMFNYIKLNQVQSKLMTDTQYEFFNVQRGEFETLIMADYCRNLEPQFLRQMAVYHQALFGGPNPNINCGSCIKTAMRKIWTKMQEYEIEKEAQRKVELETQKRLGRQPKEWGVDPNKPADETKKK